MRESTPIEFVLTTDAPEVPATSLDATPAHAVQGDVIRQRPGNDLTPFELLRNGRRIGAPEPWQVQHALASARRRASATPSPVSLHIEARSDREAARALLEVAHV